MFLQGRKALLQNWLFQVRSEAACTRAASPRQTSGLILFWRMCHVGFTYPCFPPYADEAHFVDNLPKMCKCTVKPLILRPSLIAVWLMSHSVLIVFTRFRRDNSSWRPLCTWLWGEISIREVVVYLTRKHIILLIIIMHLNPGIGHILDN